MPQSQDLIEGYAKLLTSRMNAFYEPVKEAFSKLLKSEFPTEIEGLHIEVFLDGPGFYFVIYSMDRHFCQTAEPPFLQQFHKRIEELWPIITQDEQDRYYLWEDDPKWGRQIALEQPIDRMPMPDIILPWFKSIISEDSKFFSGKITAAVHDETHAEEL